MTFLVPTGPEAVHCECSKKLPLGSEGDESFVSRLRVSVTRHEDGGADEVLREHRQRVRVGVLGA